jgi:hypothetical protein
MVNMRPVQEKIHVRNLARHDQQDEGPRQQERQEKPEQGQPGQLVRGETGHRMPWVFWRHVAGLIGRARAMINK